MSRNYKLEAINNKVMKISEWMQLDERLSTWDGKQKSWITSRNPRVINLVENGIDSPISINEIKQLRRVNEEAYYKLMAQGVSYEYERFIATVSHNKAHVGKVHVDVYSDFNEQEYQYSESYTFSKDEISIARHGARDKDILDIYPQFNK